MTRVAFMLNLSSVFKKKMFLLPEQEMVCLDE